MHIISFLKNVLDSSSFCLKPIKLFLPHQTSIEDQLPSYRGIVPKGKPFHPSAILQDQVGCLSLERREESTQLKQNLNQ